MTAFPKIILNGSFEVSAKGFLFDHGTLPAN